MKKIQQLLSHGGVLLAASAVASKILGLLRDRFMIDIWGVGAETDIISASFRVPDFFFALFIGGTVVSVFLPRMVEVKKEEQNDFFSSFLWAVVLIFGFLCGAGAWWAGDLVRIFVPGFDAGLYHMLVPIIRILFGSVFLLALSSVFGAFIQYKEKFISIALAPILYTGTIVLALWQYGAELGPIAIAYGAVTGASLHWLTNVVAFFVLGGKIHAVWKKPRNAWKGFWRDCGMRMANASVFQVNLTMDVFMASFLGLGAVTATTLGSSLGNILLTIIGIPAGRYVFPKLAKQKHKYDEQKKIVRKTLKGVWGLTVPASIIGAALGAWLLGLIFNLEGEGLKGTWLVFFPTVLTLPFVCSIPVLARVFLANDDTKTPLVVNTISLLGAIVVAATFAFVILPADITLLGLGIGNAFSNVFSAVVYGILARKKYNI